MNSSRPDIDPVRVRRLFERVAAEQADFLAREVARRMLERLDYIKILPQTLLDAGCGNGADLALMRARYPTARLFGLDQSPTRLATARALLDRGSALARLLPGWLGRRRVDWLAADLAAVPLTPGSIDLLWSNLALHWHPAPHRVIPEWRRILRVGGLAMFSCFGPDTLKEVRAAFAAIDHAPHTLPFTDMHDYGDMLTAAGFATPVMDMEIIQLTYADAAGLWRDVRALGGNALEQRRRGLLSGRSGRRLQEGLDRLRDVDGRYRLTFEIIYGHAWKAEPRKTDDGRAVIRVERPAGRKG